MTRSLTTHITKKILPEIKHEIKGLVKKYDGESDALIAGLEKNAVALIKILEKDLAEVVVKVGSKSGPEMVKQIETHVDGLTAALNMQKWVLKQYKSQADLIVNHDLKSIEAFDASVVEMDKYKDALRKSLDTDEQLAIMKNIDEIDEKYDKKFHDFIVPEVKRTMENRILKYDEEADAALTGLDENLTHLAKSFKTEAGVAVREFQSVESLTKWTVVLVSSFAALIGILLGVFITRSITKPINRVIESLSNGSEQVTSASAQVADTSQ